MDEDRINICGISIHNLTLSETLERIDRLVAAGRPSYIFTPNVDHVVRWQGDIELRRAYAEAALVLADGFPLLWAARFLGKSFKEKISGSDLVPAQCPTAARRGYKLFLLGGRPGAAEKAKRRLEETYRGIRIVGVHAPPLGFERDWSENKKIIELVRAKSPDVLLVGLGTPKQEKWIYRHYQEMGVPVSMGIGATIDFIAGVVKRAPRFMQRSGFEWLWRLSLEPGRLWKRYLVDDMQFFWFLLKQKSLGFNSYSSRAPQTHANAKWR